MIGGWNIHGSGVFRISSVRVFTWVNNTEYIAKEASPSCLEKSGSYDQTSTVNCASN